MGTSKNLSDKHILGFGHIILQWGRYEMALGKLASTMMSANDEHWLVLNSNLNYVQKRDLVRALFEHPSTVLEDSEIALLDKIIGECESLNRLRNDVAHGLWADGRRKNSITPLGIKSKGSIRFKGPSENQPNYTPEDLMKAAENIYVYARAYDCWA